MKLLFMNSLKSIKNNKIQILSIIILIMLSVSIYVGINSAIDKLENNYYNYLKKQNVEDISIDVNSDNKQEILDGLKEKYNFEYEYELSKLLINEEIYIKVMPYIKENYINIPYLLEGKMPSDNNEITILKNYAIKNNLRIGDKYKINDKEYKIVGFTYASDYIYPLLSFSTPIFEEENNNIIFMNLKEYKTVNGIEENSYAIKYNKNFARLLELPLNEDGILKDKTGIFSIFNEKEIVYNLNTITRISRISSPISEFKSNRLFADYLLKFLLGISILIIIILIKKRIESERFQIGILKILGYNRFIIATSYLTYPIIGSLIGGILGFVLGIVISKPLTNIFVGMYNIPIINNSINFGYLNIILLITLFLTILSYIIIIKILKKRPLVLLKDNSDLKVNIFNRIVSKFTKFLKFEHKFKLLIAFRSFKRLLLISIISFCTGMLIILVLSCLNLFENLVNKSFEGMKYKYLILYDEIINREEKFEQGTDYILEENISYLNNDITIIGTDIQSNYLELYDKNKNNIINLLNYDGIIINKNISETFNVKIGDKLKLKYQNIEFEYKVLGINNELIGFNIYVRRENLSKKLGFNNNVYNTIYSNDDKYNKSNNIEKLDKVTYILNLNSLKENIINQINNYNGIIHIIIIISSIISFIIIIIIANIIIEENKKNISLMKVIGYNDKQINDIVLNIYTPFIIFSYILAIPITTNILRKIFLLLSNNIEMTILININIKLIISGLVSLLIVYYLAMFIAKKRLNKIPLCEALKRD